jgi:ATPase, P-type (transporting), HAD superfamily, subfamily IC
VADGAQLSSWRLLARFAWEETLRGEVQETIEALRAQSLKLALLSGDDSARVEAVAKRLGIANALGDASPEAKLQAIQRLSDAGERVLYVGDGLNDAPALGGAAVSLALGAESAFARDAADLVSVRRDLRTVPFALGLAKSLERRLRRNLVWAVGYNVAAVPLAVAGLATPWQAALGMTLSSLFVLVHAQRLAGDGERWGAALWKA